MTLPLYLGRVTRWATGVLLAGAAFAQAQPTTPAPGSLGNISTRLQVGTGDNVMIAGFIVQGSLPKKVMIRAAGPSLSQFGVVGALANPQLELHSGSNTIGTNDDWQVTQIGGVITSDQSAEIQSSGLAPSDPGESAIIATLSPGGYTAIVQGANGGTGVGIVEVFDLSPNNGSTLANISTRGFIQTGDNVMIGGFIVATQPAKVLIRVTGPSLVPFGVSNAIANPQLELHDTNGTLAGNDDWQTTQIGGIITSDQVAAIQKSGLAPNDAAESAMIATLAPGNYTAIVQGVNATKGVGLVEVYALSEYSLTVSKGGSGTGAVTSSPVGVDCGVDCNEIYNSGTVVTLTATPATGSTFSGWSGACTGTGNCVVTIDAAKSLTANFTLNPVGAGGNCSTQPECAAGLTCVDQVCCTSACTGTCERCDVSGAVGTCSPVPDGQDPDGECGGLSCAAYYNGFQGDTCYQKADVSAAQAICNGARACRTVAQECTAQSTRGPAQITCDSFCQDPTVNTCVGTTAGTCTNVNQGNATCGLGACQTSAPRCVNGAPNACVPNSGAATAETCNGLDDNCDGVIDNGSFSDAFEPNNDCSTYRVLPQVGSDQTKTQNALTLYPLGDVDYYRINAVETDSTCACCDLFCTREDYRLTVTLSVPAGAGSYIFCSDMGCGMVGNNCQTVGAGTSASSAFVLHGVCSSIDSYSIYVRVAAGNAPGFQCHPYTLSYFFDAGLCLP